MSHPPRRSMLFVPAIRPDRFHKAIATGADIVIVDWEDAVIPTRKAEARVSVGGFFSELTERPVLRYLRINSHDCLKASAISRPSSRWSTCRTAS